MRNFIKKTLSWMLAMSMAVLPSVAASAVGEEQPTSKLQNFYYALKHKDKVNVAYLGGSVTVGVGSSDYETASWRAQVGNWLKSEYGDKVNNINAAIGATGSYFGSYRANQDTQLDGPDVPDLLFIEFAINDIYDLRTAKQIDIDYESIILQAYKANPKINIITVFTMDIDIANNIINTGKENSVPFTEQRAVAAHYGLPQINVGQALISVIKSEYENEGKTFSVSDSSDKNSIWHKYITDSCHPGDAGYKVYADTVLDYLKAQLQGNSVTRSESVYNDIALPTTYASKIGMESHLKRNGHYISFADAGFVEDNLNGWKLNNEGAIVTQYNNASFAFEFKGTAVGFYNVGSTISGKVAYTITAADDSSVKYSDTVTLKKNSSPLPFPAELKNGLADRVWKVECVIKDGGYGDVAYLRKIYINGDVSSVKPAVAPETEISDLPSKHMSAEFDITKLNDSNNDVGTGELVTNVSFEGRSNVVSVSKGSATSEIVSLNGENEISNIDISNKRYMIVDYYYTGASATQMKWQFTVADSNVIEKSSELVAGKWSTAVIPLTEDGFSNEITKYKFMPFGDKIQASAGDVLYISGIRFAYESPTVVTENGKAYVQANCYIKGVGAKIYRTLSAAIDALGTNGGTVYVSGNIVAETADKVEVTGAHRGLVTITGYGKDIAERQGNAVILSSEASSRVDWNGDVNFEAIKLTCSDGLYAGGAKVTLSNTVIYPNKLSLGLQWKNYSKTNKKSTVVSNGTNIYNVAALNSYFGKDSLEFPIKGSVDYTFNNYGSYTWIFSGSGGDSFGNLIMDGNVDYTFNGGTFYNTWVGNYRNGGVKGNTVWRINGGWFGNGNSSDAEYIHSGNILFANYNDGRRNSDRAAYMGNTALIVNSVDFRNYYTGKKNRVYMTLGGGFEIDKTGGESIAYNTGYKGNAKLGYTPEFMIVVNNAELGIAFIDKSLTDEYIDYKLKVFGGKAEPVFGGEDGRTLLGFTLTGDESGKNPYISGVKLEKVEGKDYYDLSAYKNTGIINVSFVPGLEADVNNDNAFDIRDLVHAKKVFASTDSYNEESINRAYFLGDTKGSAANLAGIRKLLLIY